LALGLAREYVNSVQERIAAFGYSIGYTAHGAGSPVTAKIANDRTLSGLPMPVTVAMPRTAAAFSCDRLASSTPLQRSSLLGGIVAAYCRGDMVQKDND
jgi:hypothetical protein